jgi:transcription-repair coupling factor (superfamily II helicase)
MKITKTQTNSVILTATLPEMWIPETRLRIEAFRKIALANQQNELKEIRDQLIDRYGRLPPEADALLKIAEIRCIAEIKGVTSITTEDSTLRCKQMISGGKSDLILIGNRFPRLTAREPLRKLTEIRNFLSRLTSSPSS